MMMSENACNASGRSSSSTASLPDTEDDQTIAQLLAEEEKKFGQGSGVNLLGRRLSHLDSIPHTPRVISEIPNADDASFDHNRLAERLTTYGLAELQIEGDGNCQFRALADQLFQNPDYHRHVRKEIVKQLKSCRKLYEAYVPMKYRRYLRKMKRTGEWGDHVTLQAAADRNYQQMARISNWLCPFSYDTPVVIDAEYITLEAHRQLFAAKISLVTSFRDTCYIEILPYDKNYRKEIWLSFWSEVHYNSLYDSGDVPTRLPKKKYWLF